MGPSSFVEVSYRYGFFHHVDHRPGAGLMRGNRCFPLVPKCGIHTFRKALEEIGFERQDNCIGASPSERRAGTSNVTSTLAVVREPIDRWVSGCLQYWRTSQNMGKTGVDYWGNVCGSLDEFIAETKDFLVTYGRPRINDVHVIPQAYYLAAFDVDRFIRMDGALEYNIQDWVGDKIHLPRLNPGNSDQHRWFLDSLEPVHEEVLRSFYKEDFGLWEEIG